MAVFIGTSGWQYDDWKTVIYEGIPKTRWLERYSREFPAVEVNNTFYNLPKEKTFADWAERTPDGFVFVCKASRFITHIRRLGDVAEPIARFGDRAKLLGDKLGPTLYQLPPNMERDDEKLTLFLDLLPEHPPSAVEFRNDTWYDPAIFSALRDHDVALVIADAPNHKAPIELTAGWSYFRLHGAGEVRSYELSYGEALDDWAKRVAAFAADADPIYVFFDNDREGNAVRDARALIEKVRTLGVAVAPPPAA